MHAENVETANFNVASNFVGRDFTQVSGDLHVHESTAEKPPLLYTDEKLLKSQRNFTGRKAELDSVRQKLASHSLAVVHGTAGFGKSAIAHQYYKRNEKLYQIALEANAESAISVHTNLRELYNYFYGEPSKNELDTDISSRLINTIHNQDKSKALFILDNLVNREILNIFPDGSKNIHVLVTARRSDWDSERESIPLGILPKEDAMQFLINEIAARNRKTRSGAKGIEPSEAQTISETLDGHALALKHAAAYLGTNKRVSVQKYVESIEEFLDKSPNPHDDFGPYVFATFQAAIRSAEATNKGAASILFLSAHLGPDEIPEILFRQNIDVYPDGLKPIFKNSDIDCLDLKSVLSDEHAREAAFNILSHLSLIDSDQKNETFSVHRMLQAAVRVSMDDKELEWHKGTIHAIDSSMPTLSEIDETSYYNKLIPHTQRVLSSIKEKDQAYYSQSIPVAKLNAAYGEYLTVHGHYDKALTPLSDSAISFLNYNELYAVQPLNSLGSAYYRMGDYESGYSMYNMMLELRKTKYGENHPRLAIVHHYLADAAQGMGDLVKSEMHHYKALALLQPGEQESEKYRHKILSGLAQLKSKRGDFKNAAKYHYQAHQQCVQNYGAMHRDIPSILARIGNHLFEQGQAEQAKAIFLRAIYVANQNHVDPPFLASLIDEFATTSYATKAEKPENVIELLKEALRLRVMAFGEYNYNVAKNSLEIGHIARYEDIDGSDAFLRMGLVYFQKHPITDTSNQFKNIVDESAEATGFDMINGVDPNTDAYEEIIRAVLSHLETDGDSLSNRMIDEGMNGHSAYSDGIRDGFKFILEESDDEHNSDVD